MRHALLRLLPSLRDYDLRYLKEDLLAGLTVSVVALPLALAFGVTSGAGAAAGLVTAIVAGVLAAAFGGSNLQVSGPTGAMTVVLLGVVHEHGVAALASVGLLAGLVLVAFAFARIGRWVQFVPWPVITGFTNGIALIILLQQLPGLLGVAAGAGEGILTASWRTVGAYVGAPGLAAPALGAATVAVMVLWGRRPSLRAVPAGIVALVAVSLLSLLPTFAEVPRIGVIPAGLPLPQWPSVPVDALGDLVRAALAVAVLAALESLLSALVADGMTVGVRHDPDRELLGQGIANVGTAMFGGIPATAALARTAVNVRSGARTRLAAITHGLALFAIVSFAAPLAGRIPLAVLAGILVVVALRMVEWSSMLRIVRATRADTFVLAATMATTVLFDLILAIEVGMVAAGVLFVIRMGRLFQVDSQVLAGDALPVAHEDPEVARAEKALLRRHVVAYRVDGPLFFGAAQRFLSKLLETDGAIRVVVLRLRRVPLMDATGADALATLAEVLERRGVRLLYSGLQEQPERLLTRMGLLPVAGVGERIAFVSTDEAIAHALAQLKRDEAGGASAPPRAAARRERRSV